MTQYSKLKIFKTKLLFAKMKFKPIDTQYLQVPLHLEKTYTVNYISNYNEQESFTGKYVGHNKHYILLYKIIGDLNKIVVVDEQTFDETFDLSTLHSIITPEVTHLATLEFAIIGLSDILYIVRDCYTNKKNFSTYILVT